MAYLTEEQVDLVLDLIDHRRDETDRLAAFPGADLDALAGERATLRDLRSSLVPPAQEARPTYRVVGPGLGGLEVSVEWSEDYLPGKWVAFGAGDRSDKGRERYATGAAPKVVLRGLRKRFGGPIDLETVLRYSVGRIDGTGERARFDTLEEAYAYQDTLDPEALENGEYDLLDHEGDR